MRKYLFIILILLPNLALAQGAGQFIPNLRSTYSTTTNATTTNVRVSNEISVGGTLTVTGTSYFTDDATFENGLTVVGGPFTVGAGEVDNTELANSTISGIALGSNLANLTATDGTLTFSGTYNGGTARTIGINLSNANTWVGNQTFTLITIPNGTNPTADDVGEIAHDTTDNQLILDDFVIQTTERIWGVTVGSTSPAFISGGLLPVPLQQDGYTVTRYQCHVTTGTSKVMAVEDASANSSEDITCATTNTTDDGSITNGVFTANELLYIDFGATSGSVDYVTIEAFGTWLRE